MGEHLHDQGDGVVVETHPRPRVVGEDLVGAASGETGDERLVVLPAAGVEEVADRLLVQGLGIDERSVDIEQNPLWPRHTRKCPTCTPGRA